MKTIIVLLIISLSVSVRILDTPINAETQGVDVSAYQGSVNWVKVASAGKKFAILRTTVRNGTMDSTFENNYKNAKAAGLEVSGYHFSYSLSTSEAKTAAKNLINLLNGKKLPIYLDLEWNNQRSLGRQAVTDIAVAFVTQMKSSGYETHIYSNKDWYTNAFYPEPLINLGCHFWLAAYGTDDGTMQPKYKPNVGEKIWQYTSKGIVNGVTGNCDLDVKY